MYTVGWLVGATVQLYYLSTFAVHVENSLSRLATTIVRAKNYSKTLNYILADKVLTFACFITSREKNELERISFHTKQEFPLQTHIES